MSINSSNHQRGIGLLSILFFVVVIVVGAVMWKKASDIKHREQAAKLAAIEKERVAAEEALAEKRRKLEEEKKDFELQVQKEKQKAEFDKSISGLDTIYSKWKDAIKLADSTARMALSGQISNLQKVKQEADALLVPDCLSNAKTKMIAGMNAKIDGLIQFLSDANIGKILAQAKFTEGDGLFAEFEKAKGACKVE